MSSSKRVQLRSGNSEIQLLLEMFLEGDRFVTEVRRASEGSSQGSSQENHAATLMAQSVEGAASGELPIWPRSAPLQEVVPQRNNDGEFLAGVGRAGKSHWSVIVTPVKDSVGFDFDFACRAKTVPACLGSTYRLTQGEIRVVAAAESNAAIQTVEPADNSSQGGSTVIIQPRPPFPERYPATIQWRYRLLLAT